MCCSERNGEHQGMLGRQLGLLSVSEQTTPPRPCRCVPAVHLVKMNCCFSKGLGRQSRRWSEPKFRPNAAPTFCLADINGSECPLSWSASLRKAVQSRDLVVQDLVQDAGLSL